MNKLLVIQAMLYTVIGALGPVVSTLASDVDLNQRTAIALACGAVLAGATALKAFLSTTFAESPASDQPKK